MFRYCYLILLILAGCGSVLRAGTFEEANTAFAAGDYVRAVPLYQETITLEGPSAGRLFNLGNAHAKLQHLGPAILAYERAALLGPRDADIRANLKLAREAARAATPAAPFDLSAPPPWWQAPAYWLSLNEWGWLAACGWVIMAAVAALRGFTREPRPWLKQGALFMILAGGLLTSLGKWVLRHRAGETNVSIVITDKPVLRLSPFAGANETGTPAPGQRVVPGPSQNGWCYVTVPGTSLRGWIQLSEIEPLVPGEQG
jgi:hypothetical protein